MYLNIRYLIEFETDKLDRLYSLDTRNRLSNLRIFETLEIDRKIKNL
jgi:hypothetical protein